MAEQHEQGICCGSKDDAVASSNPHKDSLSGEETGGEMSKEGSGETSGSLTDSNKNDEFDDSCESHYCDVCVAERWWCEAAKNNALIQQQQESILKNKDKLTQEQKSRFEQLQLIQKQILSGAILETPSPGDEDPENSKSEFNMQRLLEFFEFQKQSGRVSISINETDFKKDFGFMLHIFFLTKSLDDFWLLVIKARLFNIFRTKGPEAYNRVVEKIQVVLNKFKPLIERQNSGGGQELESLTK